MTELADRLAGVSDAAAKVEAVEDSLAQARKEQQVALRAAHDAGASLSLIGRIAGLSRERVRQIVREAE